MNNNNKVSIVMMSTFSGPSFKGPQMPDIVKELHAKDMLANSFGIYSSSDKKTYDAHILKKLRVSKVIRLLFSICKYLCIFLHSKNKYYINERIFGIFAMFHRYDGDIVLLKPRPAFLVEWFKKKGKRVVIEASENHPLFTYNQIVKECKLDEIPLIDNVYTDRKRITDYCRGVKLADRLICLSRFSLETYTNEGVTRDSIRVVNLETNIPPQVRKNTKNEPIKFVCVANHSYLKGTHKIIKVWLENNIPNELIIIGNVYPDEKLIVDKLSLTSNIIMKGSMSREDIYKLYCNNRCVNLLVSLSESYGRTIYEALCQSTPVIVTPTCTCDLVQDGHNGYIINGCMDSILNAVKKFIDMKHEVYDEFCKHAFNSVNHSNQSFGQRYVESML